MIFKFGKVLVGFLIIAILLVLFIAIFNEINYYLFSNDNSISSLTGETYEIRYDYDKYNNNEIKYFLYNWKINKVELENIESYKVDKNSKKIYIISKNNNGENVYSILKYDSFELNIYDKIKKISKQDMKIFEDNEQFIKLK